MPAAVAAVVLKPYRLVRCCWLNLLELLLKLLLLLRRRAVGCGGRSCYYCWLKLLGGLWSLGQLQRQLVRKLTAADAGCVKDQLVTCWMNLLLLLLLRRQAAGRWRAVRN
jgi:hypothetical protein